MKIAILEDNADRQAVMVACLRDKFRQYEPHVFSTSRETIEFLKGSLSNTIAISLDHDLELVSDSGGQLVDFGTGREVADFLAGQTPVCPVVIHTTNSGAATGMEMVLDDAGWTIYRVIPFDDTAWIATEWLKTIRRAIVDTARMPTKKVR